MNITSLQTFLAIVEQGSLVGASDVLRVTQSTVTARLKSLEQELGQTLLHRQKSGVKLTPSGVRLMRYAQVMTGLWRQAKSEAGLPAGLNAIFNFGCHPDLWDCYGRVLFQQIEDTHPDMAFSLIRGSDIELAQWLADGYVDVILTFAAVAVRNQTKIALPKEHLALFSDQPDSPIVGDGRYIFVDYGPGFRRLHDETYYDAGTARISFNNASWALDHLRTLGGSAYLPVSLVKAVAGPPLYPVRGAKAFEIEKNFIVADQQAQNWPWLMEILKRAGGYYSSSSEETP